LRCHRAAPSNSPEGGGSEFENEKLVDMYFMIKKIIDKNSSLLGVLKYEQYRV